MSKNDMVMVPREPTQEMKDAARNAPLPAVMMDSISGQQDLRFSAQYKAALAAAPKADSQNQGEPVALPERKDPTQHWVEPGGVHKAEGWNGCLDEIAKLGPLYSCPVQGEAVACVKVDFKPEVASGHLVWFTPSSFEPGQELKLYTHADLGEVEQLRAELTDTREAYLNQSARLVKANQEIERLKKPTFADSIKSPPNWVRAALSAIAEPIAAPQDSASAKLSVLTEAAKALIATVEVCRATREEQDDVHTHEKWAMDELEKALSSSAEPSAPVEIDEQVEFMAWANKEYGVGPDEELNLKNPNVRDNKIGWLARAALERKL